VNHRNPLFRGIFPPIPTPFGAKGNLDTDGLVCNLEWWNDFALSGYVVLGSNGEAPLLRYQEKLQLVETTRLNVSDDRLLIVGTGCQATLETVALTCDSAERGADAVLVLPPFYYKRQMTNRVLQTHYHRIADSSPVPVLIYNMPACTGLDLSAELIVELSCHENIVGLKDSGADLVKMSAIRHAVQETFSLLAGSASFLLPALSVGADGGVLALANIAPQQCLDLYYLCQKGEYLPARTLQHSLIAANTAITRKCGVPALKYAMEMIGLKGGVPRLPLLPLPEQKMADLCAILREAHILLA